MKYRAKEFRPGHWMVLDANNVPLVQAGTDLPVRAIVFQDEDQAIECARRMTKESEEKEND